MAAIPFILHRIRQPEGWIRSAKTVSLLAGVDGIRLVEVGNCGSDLRWRSDPWGLRQLYEPDILPNEAIVERLFHPEPPNPWPSRTPTTERLNYKLYRLSPIEWDPKRDVLVLTDATKGKPWKLDLRFWGVAPELVQTWLDEVAWLRVVPCPVCGKPDAKSSRNDKLRHADIVCADCRHQLTSALPGEQGRALDVVMLGPDEPGLCYRDTRQPYPYRVLYSSESVALLGDRGVRVHAGHLGGTIVRLAELPPPAA